MAQVFLLCFLPKEGVIIFPLPSDGVGSTELTLVQIEGFTA